ncbi:flagellar biosynthetic protein FliO [Sanguibacter sp. A247]|uniref:flagellar biosynthetic protein FliO n=1 Tax=unclassified Sanguibacter TaxID=2645534 RepID=UPI003FD8D4C5
MELVVPLLRTVVAVAAIAGLLWWAGRRVAGRAPSGAGLAGSGLGGPAASAARAPRRGLGLRTNRAGAGAGSGLREVWGAFAARLGERRPAPERALRVVERATLTPRASLALVEVGGRRLLLGVAEQGISVLDTSQAPVAAADDAVVFSADEASSADEAADFDEILRASLAASEGAQGRAGLL